MNPLPSIKIETAFLARKMIGPAALGLILAGAQLAFAQSSLQCDPSKVITSETCIKCHANAYEVWRQTPHFKTFDTLHRSPAAQTIARRMGISSIKRGKICIDCHYTTQTKAETVKVVSGISCESCHGAAADWVNVHNDYGGFGITRQRETEAHRQERLSTSMALGMRNPLNPYLIARSCLACHTVPNEELVNVGGHQAGSEDFEVVSWSQGTIRHNFVRSNGQANEASDQHRLRIMYLSGLVAELEFSVRATGLATQQGTYGKAVSARAARTAVKLYQIQQQIKHPLLEEILRAFAKAELKTNNSQQLNEIADTIKRAGQRLATQADPQQLGFLDHLIPPATQYK